MARRRGSKNKASSAALPASQLTPKERVIFLASIIAEQIAEDQGRGQVLQRKIRRGGYERSTRT